MNRFQLKPVITIKFNEVDRRLVQDTVNRVFPDLTEENTAKDLFHSMFNTLENPVNQGGVQLEEDEILRIIAPYNQEIQEKDNEIGRLKTLLDLKNEEIESLKLKANADNSAGVTLGLNEEIITFDPIFGGLVDMEIQARNKKSHILLTRALVLKNLFLDMIKYSEMYPLALRWTRADLQAYRDKITNKPA